MTSETKATDKPGDPADRAADGAFGGVTSHATHSHRAGYGDDKLARLVDYLRQRPSATLASGEGALLLAEIDRLHAAELDGMDHYADARAEIDRLRRILAALLSGFERRGLLPEGRPATDEDAQEAVALLFERLDRAERILSALREPSGRVIEWEDPAFPLTVADQEILAAVKAAEQEVGG